MAIYPLPLGVTKRRKSKKTECPAIVATFSSSGSEGDILMSHEHVTLAQLTLGERQKIFAEVIKFEREIPEIKAPFSFGEIGRKKKKYIRITPSDSFFSDSST